MKYEYDYDLSSDRSWRIINPPIVHTNMTYDTGNRDLCHPADDPLIVNESSHESATRNLTQEQIDFYIQKGGTQCPYCQSSALEGEEINVESGVCWQVMACLECGESWHDVYHLATIDVLR